MTPLPSIPSSYPETRTNHADVGFGSHSDYPLLLDVREDQDDPAGRFRLADADAGDIDVLKDGRPQYRIETRERSLADCVRRAPADRAVVSRLRSALAWRNEVERRVSGRVRCVTGACQGWCR